MVIIRLASILFLFAISFQSVAKVQTSASQTILEVNDIIQLKIKIDEHAPRLDLSVLDKDFVIYNIYGPNTSTTIINGARSSSTEYTINISPKRTGNITIPAITFNSESSQPIILNVRSQTHSNIQDDFFFFTASISDSTAYIDQPLLLELKFHNAIDLQTANLETPTSMPFPLTQLETPPVQTQVINSKTYQVSTLYYQITPQQAGQFKIPSFNIKGQYIYNRSTKSFDTQSNSITIDVKPIPDQYPKNTPWLPAENIILQDNLESVLNLTNGDSVTRTIDIGMTGLSNNYLSKINIPNIDGIKIYSEDELRDDRILENKNTGLIQAKWAILPTNNGTFTLPEFSITWWDVNEDKLKVSTIDPRTINVTGITTQATTQTQTPLTSESTVYVIPNWIWFTYAFLILGWGATIIIWRLQIKKVSTLSAPTNIENKVNSVNSNIEQQIKQACELKSLRKLKQAIMNFEKYCQENNFDFNVYQVALSKQLNELDITLYQSDKQTAEFDFNGFAIEFSKIKLSTKAKPESSDELVSLYPNN